MTKPIKIRDLVLGSGMPKICVPLTKATVKELTKEAENAVCQGAEIIEWRADFFEDLKEENQLKEAIAMVTKAAGQVPVLFTIRTDEEGGNASISYEEYKNCNVLAAKSGKIALVDVECFGHNGENTKIIPMLQEAGAVVIASSHDFDKTDKKEELLDRFKKMDASKADILKMAVMPANYTDVSAIMLATKEMAEEFTDKPLISMSMGTIGSVTRIMGKKFHSCLTFGTVGAASAPGQISISELRILMNIAENN